MSEGRTFRLVLCVMDEEKVLKAHSVHIAGVTQETSPQLWKKAIELLADEAEEGALNAMGYSSPRQKMKAAAKEALRGNS